MENATRRASPSVRPTGPAGGRTDGPLCSIGGLNGARRREAGREGRRDVYVTIARWSRAGAESLTSRSVTVLLRLLRLPRGRGARRVRHVTTPKLLKFNSNFKKKTVVSNFYFFIVLHALLFIKKFRGGSYRLVEMLETRGRASYWRRPRGALAARGVGVVGSL